MFESIAILVFLLIIIGEVPTYMFRYYMLAMSDVYFNVISFTYLYNLFGEMHLIRVHETESCVVHFGTIVAGAPPRV